MRKILLLVTICLLLIEQLVAHASKVVNLRCEYEKNPIGVDFIKPRLSWNIEAGQKGEYQIAYQVMVASSIENLFQDRGDLWNSGKTISGQSIQIAYNGKLLESQKKYYWKVKIWNNANEESTWSKPSIWETGLLNSGDWKAQWIGWNPGEPKKEEHPSIRVFKSFYLEQSTTEATAYVNTPCYFELYINDKKVGKDVLSPSVIDVNRGYSFYVSYNVSSYLRKGENCIEILLGKGWNKSDTSSVRFQCHIRSGISSIDIVTDSTWNVSNSPYSTIGKWKWDNFGGELYKAKSGDIYKKACESDEKNRAKVYVLKDASLKSRAQLSPLNRVGKPIRPIKCNELSNNVFVFDFGTILTGWMKLKMTKLNAGDTVTIYYADKLYTTFGPKLSGTGSPGSPHNALKFLDKNDSVGFSTYNQFDQFVSAGGSKEAFCSKFNYHAFRYAIVKGLSFKPELSNAEAMLIETDLEQSGTFQCSNELFNRMHKVNEWTMRCLNLGGYMVDCPHRERMGYGAEGSVSIESAIMNYNMASFLNKSMKDWANAQNAQTGFLPHLAPENGVVGGGGPAWGGGMASIIWRTYLYYGDKKILEDGYEPMKRYIDYLESLCTNGILRDFGGTWDFLGDWVAPGRGMDTKNWAPKQANELFNNCYRLYLWQILEKTAVVLGYSNEVVRCRSNLNELRPKIHQAFYNPELKFYVLDEQTYQIMPLITGVVPADLKPMIIDRLVNGILNKNNGHLDTGVLGTYFLIQYLQEIGRDDILFTITNQESYPGWGYMLKQGATTWWEQWNGYWSQVHNSFTSLDSWFYQGLAGIRPDPEEPGFKKIIIKPAVVGDLTWVKASYNSAFGQIVSNWKKEKNSLYLDIRIPANATATVYFPTNQMDLVFADNINIEKSIGIRYLRSENGMLLFSVQSGTYHFKIKDFDQAKL